MLNFTFYNCIDLLSHSLSITVPFFLSLFLSFSYCLSLLPLFFVSSPFLPFLPLSFRFLPFVQISSTIRCFLVSFISFFPSFSSNLLLPFLSFASHSLPPPFPCSAYPYVSAGWCVGPPSP